MESIAERQVPQWAPGVAPGLTVIIPAYNEAEGIADTVRSLQEQTLPPLKIIVVDDCSSDGTGDAARAMGVHVIRPWENTGSKAGAQNYAMPLVETEFVMAVDADTILAPDAIEKLLPSLDDPEVAAACGFVLPRRVETVWERGRYVEYMLAFNFYKPIQDLYGKPLISSGCFSVYRAEHLRAAGGWSIRTMAEDMDLTWTFYEKGLKVRFVPEAVCYPIEPHNREFMSKQLKRWSHGFIQNVSRHWRDVLHIPYLRLVIAVVFWDALIATILYLCVLPLLAVLVDPRFLLGYAIDAPAMLLPVIVGAGKRREVRKALASYPAFYVLRLVNSWFMLKAMWLELVMRKPLLVYEKGH